MELQAYDNHEYNKPSAVMGVVCTTRDASLVADPAQ
jgi:hypothetical protein